MIISQAYAPEILQAARTLNKGLKQCGNLEALGSKGTVLIHTADGDLHDLGKNILAGEIVAANGYNGHLSGDVHEPGSCAGNREEK